MKRKIYLELATTLIVGFLIGFFVNSIITDRRIKEYSMHKGESAFWKRALTEVGATPEQRQAIAPIIREYSEETRSIVRESWEQIPAVWDKMEIEIMEILTPEQQRKIKKIQTQRKKNIQERQNQNDRDRDDKQQKFKEERRERIRNERDDQNRQGPKERRRYEDNQNKGVDNKRDPERNPRKEQN